MIDWIKRGDEKVWRAENIERNVHTNGNIILPAKYIEVMKQRNYLILRFNEDINIGENHISYKGKPILLTPQKVNENFNLLSNYYSKFKKPLNLDECIHLVEFQDSYFLVGTMDVIVMGGNRLASMNIDKRKKINIPSKYRQKIGIENRICLYGKGDSLLIVPYQESFQK